LGVIQGRSSLNDEPFEAEFDRWMQHAPMDVAQSSREVCDWMKVNEKLFPRICMMAKDYLGVTSSAVPSECALSFAGTVV